MGYTISAEEVAEEEVAEEEVSEAASAEAASAEARETGMKGGGELDTLEGEVSKFSEKVQGAF